MRELDDTGMSLPDARGVNQRRRDGVGPTQPLLAKSRADHIDVIEHPYMWYYVAVPA